jgi:integrase/recombinase XerD
MYRPPCDVERDYLLSLAAPQSRARMRRCIAKLIELTGGDWAALDKRAVLRAVRALDGLAVATQRLHVACLRGLLRVADVDPRIIAAAKPRRGQSPVAGRALTSEEQTRLLEACRSDRDRALVAVLACGLRVGEAVALDVADFDADHATLLVRHSKGQPRVVVCSRMAVDALFRLTTGLGSGALLRTRAGERLAVRGAQGVLAAVARRAGVGHVSPHDLRRSCVTQAISNGARLDDVRVHVGHAQLTTTQRYLRADPREQSRAVARALSM